MTQLSLTGRYNDGSGAAALPEAQRYQPELSNAQTPSQESSQESVAWKISGPKDYTEQMYREQSGGYGGFLRGGDNPLDIEAQKKKEDDMDFMEWAAEEAQKAYEAAYNDFMDFYKETNDLYEQTRREAEEIAAEIDPDAKKALKETEEIKDSQERTVIQTRDGRYFAMNNGKREEEITDENEIAGFEQQKDDIHAHGKTIRSELDYLNIIIMQGNNGVLNNSIQGQADLAAYCQKLLNEENGETAETIRAHTGEQQRKVDDIQAQRDNVQRLMNIRKQVTQEHKKNITAPDKEHLTNTTNPESLTTEQSPVSSLHDFAKASVIDIKDIVVKLDEELLPIPTSTNNMGLG